MFEVVVHGDTLQTFAAASVWIGIGDIVAVGEVFLAPVVEGHLRRQTASAYKHSRSEGLFLSSH